MPSIQAKVAEIISEYILAINVGSSRGVKEGDAVSVRRSVEISDPDTGEKLGTVSVVKLLLNVSQVQQKFCTATVTSLQDLDVPPSTRVPRQKKIVKFRTEVKQGVSVYVEIGDRADVEASGFSDEPPF